VVTVLSIGIVYLASKKYVADSLTDTAMEHYYKTKGEGMERTLALLKMALMVDPTNYKTLMTMGEVLIKDGKTTEAEQYFVKGLAASKSDLQSFWAHDIVAEICLFQGRLEEAYVHLKLMEKNPVLATSSAGSLLPPTTRNSNPILLRGRIAILAILQSHEAEAQKYIQQLQTDANYVAASLPDMCSYYGYELWNNGKPDLAYKIYLKAMDLDPTPANILNVAVASKEYLKDSKKFHEYLTKAEEILSKSKNKEDELPLYRTFSHLKRYWLDQNNLKNALQYMQKIETLAPTDGRNFCDMGLVCRQLGRHKESTQYLSKALATNSTNKKYMMELAISYLLQGKKAEAREYAAMSGREKAIWTYVGDYHLKNKDKKKALEAFKEGLSLFPEDAELQAKIQEVKS